MKKWQQGIILAILVFSTLTSGVTLAKTVTEQIEVSYNDIKVYKDNVLYELNDANGEEIEPFIYNGTTYMPVRGTAELSGLDVTWDGDTYSVYLWDETSPEDVEIPAENPITSDSVQIDEFSPIITIIDDDTTSVKSIESLKAICDSHGVKATFSAITSLLTESEKLKNTLLSYQAEGYQIISHSRSHSDSVWLKNATIENWDFEAVENDMINSLNDLHDMGFTDCDYMAYPWGSFHWDGVRGTIQDLAKKYYKCACNSSHSGSTVYNSVEAAATSSPFMLNRFNLDNSVKFDTLKSVIDATIENNGWLIIMTHCWDFPNGSSVEVLDQALEYIISQDVAVKTLGEAWEIKQVLYGE